MSENRLERDKFVKVMADYSSNCIWQKNGTMASLCDLPVGPDTFFALGRWAAWHDDRNSNDPIPDIERFALFGWSIVQSIKLQLPDWTVAYFDPISEATVIKVKLWLSRSR
jgi:hypothetical protein